MTDITGEANPKVDLYTLHNQNYVTDSQENWNIDEPYPCTVFSRNLAHQSTWLAFLQEGRRDIIPTPYS